MARGDWLRPDRRTQYDSTDTIPFKDWLRQSRTPEPHDQALGDFMTRGTRAIHDAADAAMQRLLGGKTPKKE